MGYGEFTTLCETVAPPAEGLGEFGREAREGRHTDLKFGQIWTKLGTESGHKTTQRIIDNHLKIPPGRVPRTPRISPGTLPGHPRAKKNHMCPNRWPTFGQKVRKVGRKSSQRDHPGTQVGSKMAPKCIPKSIDPFHYRLPASANSRPL